MVNLGRRGVAYHEACHAVVARATGLSVGAIEICADDAGTTEIDSDQDHICTVDRIAICVAGIEGQKLFAIPLHKAAGYSDYGKVIKLVEGLDDDTSLALRNAGYERARKLLETYKTLVCRLADYLTRNGRIDQTTVNRLLASGE